MRRDKSFHCRVWFTRLVKKSCRNQIVKISSWLYFPLMLINMLGDHIMFKWAQRSFHVLTNSMIRDERVWAQILWLWQQRTVREMPWQEASYELPRQDSRYSHCCRSIAQSTRVLEHCYIESTQSGRSNRDQNQFAITVLPEPYIMCHHKNSHTCTDPRWNFYVA